MQRQRRNVHLGKYIEMQHIEMRNRCHLLAPLMNTAKKILKKEIPQYLITEQAVIQRYRRERRPEDAIPLEDRAADAWKQVINRIKDHPSLASWRVTLDVNRKAHTPSCTIHNIGRPAVDLAVNFSCFALYYPNQVMPFESQLLPVEIVSREKVTLFPGGEPEQLLVVNAVEFPKHLRKQYKIDSTPTQLPMRTLYCIVTEHFVTQAKTRSGAISGARTRLTNRLAKALGE